MALKVYINNLLRNKNNDRSLPVEESVKRWGVKKTQSKLGKKNIKDKTKKISNIRYWQLDFNKWDSRAWPSRFNLRNTSLV